MKAIVIDSGNDYIDPMRRELLDWARGLGVDTRTAMARFMLAEHADGWRAHFGMKRQRDGHDYVLPGTNRVAADFDLAVPVAEGSWPAWFGDATDFPDVEPAFLLELLWVVDDAGSRLRSAAWHHQHPVEVPA